MWCVQKQFSNCIHIGFNIIKTHASLIANNATIKLFTIYHVYVKKQTSCLKKHQLDLHKLQFSKPISDIYADNVPSIKKRMYLLKTYVLRM